MLVYLLFYVLLHVEAAPIFVGRAESQASNSPSQRTLVGIAWSCISTITICAWTSVHPNVPPPNRLKARWDRLTLIFWMIVAPELVLAWAIRQLFAAREIRDEYNRRYPDLPEWRKWTLKNGHFLEMGGFILVDPEKEDLAPNEQQHSVLTLDYFKAHSDIEIPKVTAADIADRSKGDALSKIIAILQTKLFFIQCIARGQQRLALTELELITLALVILDVVTFVIWYHKPLGVQEPIRIYLKMKTEKAEQVDEVRGQDEYIPSFNDVVSRSWELVKKTAFVLSSFSSNPCSGGVVLFLRLFFFLIPTLLIYVFTLPFFILFPFGAVFLLRVTKTEPTPRHRASRSRGLLASEIVSLLQELRHLLTSQVSKFVANRMAKIFEGGSTFDFLFGWFIFLPSLFLLFTLFVTLLTPLFAIFFLVSFIFTSVFGIVATSSIRPGADHVPSFYAPNTRSDRWSRMLVFALFGFIFGGLHCIGWNFNFPTRIEQILWRYTSLGITVIPLVVAPIDYFMATRLGTRDINSCPTFEKVALLILDLVMTVLLFVYVPVRLSIIAQAFALMRNQPASAFTAVDWTKYIPRLVSF